MARWPAKISSLREQAVAALAFFSKQVFDPATGYITGDFDLIRQEIRRGVVRFFSRLPRNYDNRT
jgi:hypothetical protein